MSTITPARLRLAVRSEAFTLGYMTALDPRIMLRSDADRANDLIVDHPGQPADYPIRTARPGRGWAGGTSWAMPICARTTSERRMARTPSTWTSTCSRTCEGEASFAFAWL